MMAMKNPAAGSGAKRRDESTPARSEPRDLSFMAFSQFVRRMFLGCAVLMSPAVALAQGNYATQGGEYSIGGTLLGDQVYADISLRPSGGIMVWQDNATDGSGHGISALRLDSGFSASFSSFRVNQQGANDQSRPRVALLNNGGAVVVWQGGRLGFQGIYARFLAPNNTWLTGDVLVNSHTNHSKLDPVVTVLKNGNVLVLWSSYNQESTNSLQGVYGQRLSPIGEKIGGEFRVNETTAFNQRAPAVAALSDGRFVATWVSEQQRFVNSVDIYARVYDVAGSPASGEFLVNYGTNATGYPSVSGNADGSYVVAWSERDSVSRDNGWDIRTRAFTAAGAGGTIYRLNDVTFGDQIAPRLSTVGSDHLAVWTSVGQDGSREGVYGRFVRGDASLVGVEFRVNTTFVSQQMQPTVASDGTARFLVAWSGFTGGQGSFDLFAQRFASTDQPVNPPDRPFVSVLSSNALSVTWPAMAGLNVSNYMVYADGALTPTALVSGNAWKMTELAPGSTHFFQLAYTLADGRQSPRSGATTNTTYSALWYFNEIPQEWMTRSFGSAFWTWPSPLVDSDGDGASNLQEFQAGTDPNDGSSVLRVRLQKTAQGAFLNWNTQPGQIYQVQAAANLEQWSNLGGLRFAAGHLDSLFLGLTGNGYYRVLRVR
jgi:hypothetical protein